MNKAQEYIQGVVDTMKPGECFEVTGQVFREGFAWGWPSLYETPEQSFLSKQIGSAWGRVTVEQHPFRDTYTIGRHEPGTKRVYADPDRMHLYKRMPDGSLASRGE